MRIEDIIRVTLELYNKTAERKLYLKVMNDGAFYYYFEGENPSIEE